MSPSYHFFIELWSVDPYNKINKLSSSILKDPLLKQVLRQKAMIGKICKTLMRFTSSFTYVR